MINTSPLAFGTMQCGGRADAAQSMAMFHACYDAGIRHFDTAWIYTDGASETLLGQFAQSHDIQIATKVGYTGGSGRANLTAQFDTSRKRLGRDGGDLGALGRVAIARDDRAHWPVELCRVAGDEGASRGGKLWHAD
jgi:aryl-alcohol dehydrogenase-like predicted oxidoreductase